MCIELCGLNSMRVPLYELHDDVSRNVLDTRFKYMPILMLREIFANFTESYFLVESRTCLSCRDNWNKTQMNKNSQYRCWLGISFTF